MRIPWKRGGCMLLFLALCAGLLAFLHPFVLPDNSGPLYLKWESAAILSADGAARPFDPIAGQPELEGGEWFRLRTTLPKDRNHGCFLIYELTGAEIAVFLDERELLDSSSRAWEDTLNLSQAEVPLPAGGGETLTMDLRPLSTPMNLFPPMARLTEDPDGQDLITAAASYYALPAGAAALALAMLCGLFLLGVAEGRTQWRLLLLVPAAAVLTVYPIATGLLSHEQARTWLVLLGRPWVLLLSILAMAVWLTLHREPPFWRFLGGMVLGSAGVLAVCALLSYLRDGHLARYLLSLADQLRAGYWSTTLYWLDLWLVGLCVLLSAWELAQAFVRMRMEAQALALKNRTVMENYRSIEEKLRQSAALRHEFSHQLAALDAMYQKGDLEGLGRALSAWRVQSAGASQVLYTRHTTVNAILQDAAGRAERLGTLFQASALLPAQLPIPDEDLCTLLMNLLDNALEGAAGTPAGTSRSIRVRIVLRNGFLGVSCTNSYSGTLNTDSSGRLRTTKEDPTAHGFGLDQMTAVAEKYHSILDISYTDTEFTVQTALKLPEQP